MKPPTPTFLILRKKFEERIRSVRKMTPYLSDEWEVSVRKGIQGDTRKLIERYDYLGKLIAKQEGKIL